MATQKGRNWSSGDIVTAANLSSIERGVSEVAEEYTPTTWANGNTVTAAGLNNIEQGIVNAGGGSSDFSTANVTIVNDSAASVTINASGCPCVWDDPEFASGIGSGLYSVEIAAGESVTIVVPLYKGLCDWSNSFIPTYYAANVSGNIESYGEGYLITGDGTITLSYLD